MSDGNGHNQDDIETPVIKVRETKRPEHTVIVAALDSSTRVMRGVLLAMEGIADRAVVREDVMPDGEVLLLADHWEALETSAGNTKRALRNGRG